MTITGLVLAQDCITLKLASDSEMCGFYTNVRHSKNGCTHIAIISHMCKVAIDIKLLSTLVITIMC